MPTAKLTSPMGEFKIIPKAKVPHKRKQSSDNWLKTLNSIPEEHALVATEKELGIRAQSLKNMVDRLKEDERLKGNFEFTTRTIDGKLTVYVVHHASEEEGK